MQFFLLLADTISRNKLVFGAYYSIEKSMAFLLVIVYSHNLRPKQAFIAFWTHEIEIST